MATVTIKKEGCQRRRKSYSDTTNIEWKKEADGCREFGIINSTIQTIWKNRTKIKCFWTERVENKAISKAWTKWRRWGAAEVV